MYENHKGRKNVRQSITMRMRSQGKLRSPSCAESTDGDNEVRRQEHQTETRNTHLASSGDRTSRLPPGVEGVLTLVVLRLLASRVDAGTNVGPGAIVERLLLQNIMSHQQT